MALTNSYKNDSLVLPQRSVYEDWWDRGKESEIRKYFAPWEDEELTIFIASGVLDPTERSEHLEKVNFLLPRNVIAALSDFRFSIVTFGTAMELISPGLNEYVRSKCSLGQFVDSFEDHRLRTLHVRLHTLYGSGTPNENMFLGQILKSIREYSEFNMTAGSQLREYHHIEDDLLAVKTILATEGKGCFDITHGKPVSLRTIAEYIFEHFAVKQLLNVGSIPGNDNENYQKVLPVPREIEGVAFRETLPALVEYIQECLEGEHEVES